VRFSDKYRTTPAGAPMVLPGKAMAGWGNIRSDGIIRPDIALQPVETTA
jgi:hypothetical protein